MNRARTAAIVLVGAATAALLAGLALGARTAPDVGPESLELPEVVDLGTHRYGQTVAYQFTVRNASSAGEITIASVSSECVCTTTVAAPLALPPGASSVLSGVYALSTGPVHSDRAPIIPGAATLHAAPTPITLEGDGWRRHVEIVAHLAAPLVLTSANESSGWTFEPHPLYLGRVERVEFFAPGAVEPLAHHTLTPESGAPTYTLPPAVRTVTSSRPSSTS